MSAASPTLEAASPRALPSMPITVALALTGLGVVSFLGGLFTDPATAWRAFHVNTLFFAGLGQGGVVLVAILTIVGARWAGPVRRIAEGLSAWVPVTFVLAAIGFIGGREYVYPWIENPIPAKAAWLNVPRVLITDLAVLGVMAILSHAFLKASLRPTLYHAKDQAEGLARSMMERWTADWQGDEAELRASERRMQILAPIICMVYAVGYSIIGFDMVMSLSPMWFSNLFGAYFAWGGFLSAVSATALLCALHRNYPGLEGLFTRSRFHDLGKMIFAFSIFWMYLFFSQYMIIWYGNLPEETTFFAARLGSEFLQGTWYFDAGWWDRIREPYVRMSLFTWLCCWVIPFWFLLGQRPKKTWWFLASVASVSVFGFWMERNVLVWPSLVPDDPTAPFGLVQFGIAAGFTGAFAGVYLVFTRVFPSLAVPRRP